MKTVEKRVLEKRLKLFNKQRCWQINKIIQTERRKFPSKITVVVSYNMQNNVLELWLFLR